MMFQLFNVFNARSDERSAFGGLFSESLAVGGGRIVAAAAGGGDLHAVSAAGVLDREPEPQAIGCLCTAVASSVLWLREMSKAVTRASEK